MLRAGFSVETLAEAAGVTGKSVQRWVAGEVTPFSRTRFRVAALLKEDEGYLWPQAVNRAALAGAELVATYPRRTDVPAHLWTDLLRAAGRSVDVLAFAGLFLTEEHSGWLPALAGKVGSDVRIRLLLGDPGGGQLAARDLEYSIGGGVAGRVSAVLGYYWQLPDGVELTGLVGVFSDPRHLIAYPGGEVRVPVNVCFYGQPVSGELATDSESEEAAWVLPEDLDDYDIHPAIRRRISHALNGTVPHVDLTAAGREAGMGWGGSEVSARGGWFPWGGVVCESFAARRPLPAQRWGAVVTLAGCKSCIVALDDESTSGAAVFRL